MEQLSFDAWLAERSSETIAETSLVRPLSVHESSDAELLGRLGIEVATHRGSIHELLRPLQGQNARVDAFTELVQRYLRTPLPKGTTFGCPHDIFVHYQYLRELKQEHFIVVLLNTKHEVQAEVTVAVGTLNRTVVGPREVYCEAIKQSAAAIVCLHNHPSGAAAASEPDIEMTRRLKKVGTVVGIPLLDHIIIGDGAYVSMADEQWI